MKVILDTNFLIYSAKNKLDYVYEISNLINESFELVVPEQVILELKKVINKTKERNIFLKKFRNPRFKKTTGADKLASELALQLLEFNKIKTVKAIGRNVDEAIINLAKEDKKNIVCTLDREMRHKLGRVILINKMKKLMLTK